MTDIIIQKKNEVYLKLICDPHIKYELSPYFAFEIPNAKFFRNKRYKGWNGMIHLLNLHSGELYVGLLDKLIEKIKALNYTYEFENSEYYGLPYEENEIISLEGVRSYMKTIIPSTFELREYQVDAVFQALRHQRKLLVSPTSSGKTMISYSISRYFLEKGHRILIICPTTSLIEQTYKDFYSYGLDSEQYVHRIYSGKEKTTDKQIVVSTYHSIYDLPKSFFDAFDVVIVDECFSGDMRVLTPSGYIKIKDLTPGEKVINYDSKSNTFKEDNIIKVHKNLSLSSGEKMYKLEFDNGISIEVTGNHKFLTDSGWVRADELNETHSIINIS